MDILQKIYNYSPRNIQTILLNIKAYNNKLQRRSGSYRSHLDWLLRFQWANEKDIKLWQINRFRDVYSQAAKNVPYYNKLFKALNFNPNQFENIEQIKVFPLLTKEMIRENVADFTNQSLKADYKSHTGGTTGAPLETPWDNDSLRWSFAIMDRFYLNSGVNYFSNSAHLTGNPVVPHNDNKTFGRYSYIDNTLFLSINHLKSENFPYYLEELKKKKTLWIEGYTSFIYEMAQWINHNNLSGQLRLSAVFPTSEMVTDEIRSEIEKAFACPVFNHYGSTEGITLITQCPAGNMHVVPESGFIEFVREDGTEAMPGELAEMVMTNLRNWNRPILRYKVGDYAILSDTKCVCGRNWQVVKEIAGRRAEFIKTPDGRTLSHFSHLIFKVTSKVKQSQIIQEKLDKFSIKIVKGSGYDQAEENLIRNRFREVLRCEATLDIEYVNEIPRQASGKRPTVISRCEKI